MTIICVKASVKYFRILGKIKDNIDRQAHLLKIEGSEYLQQIISEQEAKIKSLKNEIKDLKTHVSNLNKTITQNEPRMAPKPYKEQ
ncbi:MAG: hypothetical protein Ta2E_11530 [Mycoplasmoidaceae bacterium]|nr:MAG: hypothetical protein Ta2E_11530 [Mycoplasmoidaceae bacterium]